jgi:tRNA U34 5-methylaminomethyl-2-thiouridine-forming methyltransferase MnmC
MGFGTGLNAFLAYQYCSNNKINLRFKGIEKYPISYEVIEKMNYASLLQMTTQELSIFKSIHNNQITDHHTISNLEATSIEVIEVDARDHMDKNTYDIIFFDAFGPATQPQLWTEVVMQRMYDLLNPNGILTTFCAQGQFKRNLKSVGFEVERLPGPPGKREMTRATKPL